MTLRLLHYSDLENAYDDPTRIGRLAATIDARRDDRTLVVGTGDDTAPGVLALETEGRQALEFFDAVAPDAETFGNHDFDFGPANTRDVVADSPQPWLSANVYEPDGERRFADAAPGLVIERDGTSVGLLGLTDPKTPAMCPPAADLVFADPVAAARETVADLRARGVDHVVVLSHLGRGDDELARTVDVDVILGGHLHSERRDRVAGTLLTRPGPNGAVLWEVELDETGATATRHDVTETTVDAAVADRLRTLMDATGLSEVVAVASDPIVRDRERRFGGECRVGNLVADAYRWVTDADVAFTNTGGLRDGPSLDGEVTVADLVGLSPFAGRLRTAEVRGDDLRALVERAATLSADLDGKRWFGHVSGLAVVWDREAMELVELTHEGDPVDPAATYTLATNGFVVGAEQFPAPTREDVVADHGVQYDAIVAYARERGLDVELDGRLQDI
ncbi:5'-nucleotidase, C-terminal domain [Halogranum amylolyticum]|uniref:5'-nucleotidase, C-terminal domain n=1 Tax=Halogranum amylolyticum TaxID=660520 RepID=A0A1H8TU81_9EURY|nr:5'-nucleotidase C-terminal domain-containing protein [Halogranum amylolyticum]SEO93978.1 5'-nucleotidase, C-terminal domain [Halogranum amylolyticum]